ncbi:MAG: hypothetical protein R3F16_11690 [Myxococcota bacterium]|nr:hypothetical protein [Myxococcales bacterium]
MRREVSDRLVECLVCGVAIDVERERGYPVGEGDALCFRCARDRGARFDEEEDRWSVQADTLDLEGGHRVR